MHSFRKRERAMRERPENKQRERERGGTVLIRNGRLIDAGRVQGFVDVDRRGVKLLSSGSVTFYTRRGSLFSFV